LLSAAPLALVITAACGGGAGTPASRLVAPPKYEPEGETKCKIATSQSEPLIVEWPSPARAKLEALSKSNKGLVAVRYSGCEMEVLGACKVQGTYGYTPLTPKRDHVTVRDADELYTKIPLGAARLEGTLQRAGQLDVSMTIVGRFASDTTDFTSLEGPDCSRATHVVSALTVGAFDFFAGGDASIAGGASVMGAGAGGASHASRELLNSDGTEDRCNGATSNDPQPPDGCGAIVRLEVMPIDASRAKSVGPKNEPPLTSPTGTETPSNAVPPAIQQWQQQVAQMGASMKGETLEFSADESGRSYTVSIETEEKTYTCDAPVTKDTPCTLTGVPIGPARIHIGGDGDLTSNFAIQTSGKVKVTIVHHSKGTALAIFGALAVGGGVATVIGYANTFSAGSTPASQANGSTGTSVLTGTLLGSLGLAAAVVGLYGFFYALRIEPETLTADRLGMPQQQFSKSPFKLESVGVAPTPGGGASVGALLTF
jgi:hypothetical protein